MISRLILILLTYLAKSPKVPTIKKCLLKASLVLAKDTRALCPLPGYPPYLFYSLWSGKHGNVGNTAELCHR